MREELFFERNLSYGKNILKMFFWDILLLYDLVFGNDIKIFIFVKF